MFDKISRKGIIFGRVIIKKVVNGQRKIRGRFAIEIILEKSWGETLGWRPNFYDKEAMN